MTGQPVTCNPNLSCRDVFGLRKSAMASSRAAGRGALPVVPCQMLGFRGAAACKDLPSAGERGRERRPESPSGAWLAANAMYRCIGVMIGVHHVYVIFYSLGLSFHFKRKY